MGKWQPAKRYDRAIWADAAHEKYMQVNDMLYMHIVEYDALKGSNQ
jgi:hypothetical protein